MPSSFFQIQEIHICVVFHCRGSGHAVVGKSAKCNNTPDQCCCGYERNNHSSSCFGPVKEWSRPDGADRCTTENHSLEICQVDRTAADYCGMGEEKKSDAKQIA